MRNRSWREHALLVGLLAAVFAQRAWRAEQPILENYVGRQVPTAMVARNLAGGSGFLRPQLDTGPFPNLFLVEPPLQARLAAWTSSGAGLPLDVAGRLVSAAATALAAWGLFGLMDRRRGPLAAVGAVVAFAAFPVTIRYGRAFQPDAMAMGLVVAGMNLWDRPGRLRTTLGGLLLGVGLAQKITWSPVLVPLLMDVLRDRPRRLRVAAVACLLPAFAWYLHAGMTISGRTAGSAASIDNASNWLSRLTSASLLEPGRILAVGRDFLVRSFTPIGIGLALVGLVRRRGDDRLWWSWTLASGLMLVILFGKLHHDYYWLLLAPAMAAWVGIGLDALGRRSRPAAAAAIALLVLLGGVQSRSTWRTPEEWRDAGGLAASVRRHVPPDGLLIAPEAVIYLGERRGCRLEWGAGSVRRAANEWRPEPAFAGDDPAALVAFYRERAGARFFADLETTPCDPARRSLHEAIRRDPTARVLDDQPGRHLLVAFDEPDGTPPRGEP